MAEPGLKAPDILVQLPRSAPQDPQPPDQPAPEGRHVIHVNWSHFKPEFPGKPEEDPEAHFL